METQDLLKARLAKKLAENLEQEMDNIFDLFKDKLYLVNKEVAPILRQSEENLRQRISSGYYKDVIQPKIKEKETTVWNKFKFLQKYFSERIENTLDVAS